MPSDLWRTLREAKDNRDLEYPDCPWVFHKEGKKISNYRDDWEKACVTVGLGEWKLMPRLDPKTGTQIMNQKTGEPRMRKAYRGRLFHDLRRSGVRNLIRAGVSEDVAMKISGHKTRSIFSRYNVTDEEDLREAAKKQEQHLACHIPVTEEGVVGEARRIMRSKPIEKLVPGAGIEPARASAQRILSP